MDKTKKKKDNYNDDIIIELVGRYGYTRDYVLKSIRGDRTGTIPTRIQDEYNQLDRASKAAIQKKSNQL